MIYLEARTVSALTDTQHPPLGGCVHAPIYTSPGPTAGERVAFAPVGTAFSPQASGFNLPFAGQAPAARPQDVHVGDSSFESWFSTYSPAHKSSKQQARDAYAAGMSDPLVTAAQPQGEAVAGAPADRLGGAEEWMPLAWALCADEFGEDACTELVWEGGAIPEPWGDRWLKYEGEAKRMIALVRKHVPTIAPPAPQSLTDAAPAIYPHHCAPDDVDALAQHLEALADPAQQATPTYENTDWRMLASVSARVIKYLSAELDRLRADLAAAQQLAADRLAQMQADRKQALVWRDEASALRAQLADARSSCATTVFLTRIEAGQEDADDLGVSGWLSEAEDRIRRGI